MTPTTPLWELLISVFGEFLHLREHCRTGFLLCRKGDMVGNSSEDTSFVPVEHDVGVVIINPVEGDGGEKAFVFGAPPFQFFEEIPCEWRTPIQQRLESRLGKWFGSAHPVAVDFETVKMSRSARAAEPKVIHRDVSGWAFIVRPWEVAAMLADVDSFCFGTGGGGGCAISFGKLDRAE